MKKGYSIIEILVAIGVIGFVITAAVGVFSVTREASRIAELKLEASYYLTEYMEYTRNIRRADWDNLTNGRYVFVNSNGSVSLAPTSTGETVNGFTRYVELSDVYRDSSGNLLDSPGLTDPSSKYITVAVSWQGIKSGTLSHRIMLTRYLDSLSWVDTTYAEFNQGQTSGTAVVNNNGGEVVLGAGGGGNWCEPNLSIAALDLPKNGVAQAVTAIEGRAFAGTGENASGESFVNIGIGNTHPPTATILGVMNGYKTNDVFGETDYGYIATDTNAKEISIIQLSTSPYSEVGYFNADGVQDATSVYISGNVGFMTQGTNFRAFDLNPQPSDPSGRTGSRSQLASATLTGMGNAVVVQNGYAYVATTGTDKLEIFDVSSLNDPGVTDVMTKVGWARPVSQGAEDVVVNSSGTRVYLVTTNSTSQREFFIINTEIKSGLRPEVGSYDTSPMSPNAVEIVPGARAIVVGQGGTEYQVINITNEGSPVACGTGLNIDTGIFDSASILESDNDAYSYIVTGDASAELKIIEGGPGGAYAVSGEFESRTFDPGFNSTAYNRIDVTADLPIQSSIRYQVAIVDPGVSGTCSDADFSDFNFIGSDGTAATFFTGDAVLPFSDDGVGYENPAQCFRYRAYLETTDYANSPTLNDFTVLYSP
jgi:type II secretory pathway pseudopilin PulG